MFLWRNVANYPRIIPVTPSYLELCVLLKATLPRCFRVAYWHFVISLVTNCIFSYLCKFGVTCNQALHMRL